MPLSKIPSPKDFFGVVPGSDRTMIRWDKLCEYYYLIESLSDRVKIECAGESSEGNPFIFVYVSSKENLENLEHYREISVKLSDPRNLTEAEIESLADEGKVVCMQSYGLHSNEVGGPQMVPNMLYELATGDDSEILEVLENEIFIICPCAEPDGEIIFTDWYHKYLGTEYEGCVSPYLRHNWAGHSNNRDALREAVIESKYLNDVLVRNWKPQIYQDHHHQNPGDNRMSIAPKSDPIYTNYCPLLSRETSVYGNEMAMALSIAGKTGVVVGDKVYADSPITTFYANANLHNTAGMLTETADVDIATPRFHKIEEINGITSPSVKCPDPWEGGEWTLPDITSRMYIASMALVKYAAHNKTRILRQMALKGLMQTQRGEESQEKAYIIPANQHDVSTMNLMLELLTNQCVEMFTATEEFECGNRKYPKGSVVVPLAQPYYAVVKKFLAKEPHVPLKDIPHDSANENVAMPMGVMAIPANDKIDEKILAPYVFKKAQAKPLPMPAEENISYVKANELLAKGEKLSRNENGDFLNNGEGTPIRQSKIALVKKSATWNEEEGFTRNLLRRSLFDYRVVLDKEIRENGVDDDIDVIIIPGDATDTLTSGDVRDMDKPPRFQSGLGTSGGKAIVDFVNKGGRLIVWEKSCEYADLLFSLGLVNEVAQLSKYEYNTYTSQIYVHPTADKLTLGMPKEVFTATYSNGPIYETIPEGIEVIARIADTNPLANGYIIGEEHLNGAPCILRPKHGKGEILLYTFNPEFRIQQDGTFKLLFNALFEEC